MLFIKVRESAHPCIKVRESAQPCIKVRESAHPCIKVRESAHPCIKVRESAHPCIYCILSRIRPRQYRLQVTGQVYSMLTTVNPVFCFFVI